MNVSGEQDVQQEFQKVTKSVETPYISPEQATRDFTDDADALYKAMKGFGTDESTLISILGNRSRTELHHIDLAYRAKHGRFLTDIIKEECDGKFKIVLCGIIQPPELTDAMYLHDAMSGVGTNEHVLNEILATREGSEMDKIKLAYVTVFGNELESMIKSNASEQYKTLLLVLMSGARGKNNERDVDQNKVLEDAKNLYEHPTDAEFTNIIGNASYDHRMAIREIFDKKYGKSVGDVIKKAFSGGYQSLLIDLMTPKYELFADRLHKALKAFVTDDETLIRIITTRFGVDLKQIEAVYQQKFSKQSLFAAIKSGVSGDYQRILLKLIEQ